MDLVNQTAIPAHVRTGWLANTPNRRGWLTAKATFRIEQGRAVLDRDAPLGVLPHDQPYGDGFLPGDLTVRQRDPFEVMLVGAVKTPKPVTHQRVRMSIGAVARDLDVIGDRVWEGDVISAPLPFVHMPLVWQRAFGGTADVEIDQGAKVPVSDPMNPLGVGFDVATMAAVLERELKTPPGFPIVPKLRRLPNLENPAERIRTPRDAPKKGAGKIRT